MFILKTFQPASEASLPPEASQVVAEGNGLRVSKYYLLGVFGVVLRFWSCLKEAFTKTARKCPSFSELFWECDKTSSVVSGTFDVTFEINFSYVFNGG